MKDFDPEHLIDDLRKIIAGSEELLRATAGATGDGIAAARDKAEDSLHAARRRLEQAEHRLLAGARDAGRAADRYVHRNPWNAIGVAAAVAFLLGLLTSRR